jgi:hypothetical protein
MCFHMHSLKFIQDNTKNELKPMIKDAILHSGFFNFLTACNSIQIATVMANGCPKDIARIRQDSLLSAQPGKPHI